MPTPSTAPTRAHRPPGPAVLGLLPGAPRWLNPPGAIGTSRPATIPTRCSQSTRDACPVQRVRLADGHDAYLVLGYEAARQALKDGRLSKDMLAALDQDPDVMDTGLPGPAFARHMLAVDPPDHTRLRRLVAAGVRAEPDRRARTGDRRHRGGAARRPRGRRGRRGRGDGRPGRGPSPSHCPSVSSATLLGVPHADQAALRESFRTLFRPWSGSPPPEAVAASDSIVATLGPPRRGTPGRGPRRPRRSARHRERRRRPADRAGAVVEPVPADRRRARHDHEPDRQRRRRTARSSRPDAGRARGPRASAGGDRGADPVRRAGSPRHLSRRRPSR